MNNNKLEAQAYNDAMQKFSKEFKLDGIEYKEKNERFYADGKRISKNEYETQLNNRVYSEVWNGE